MGVLVANSHRDKVGSRFLRFHRHEDFRLGFAVAHFRRKLGSLALVALLAFATPPVLAGSGVFVPCFWDPHHRPAKPDLSRPYYTTPARFASLKAIAAEPATPESLREKTVGVETKSAHEAYLEKFFPDTIRKSYGSQMLLREALAKGEIDTIFGDGISLSLWLDSQDGRHCCGFRGGPFLDARFFGEGAGVGGKRGTR